MVLGTDLSLMQNTCLIHIKIQSHLKKLFGVLIENSLKSVQCFPLVTLIIRDRIS